MADQNDQQQYIDENSSNAQQQSNVSSQQVNVFAQLQPNTASQQQADVSAQRQANISPTLQASTFAQSNTASQRQANVSLPSQTVQSQNVNRIQVRVPPFWKQNPQLWFKQLEAQFATSGITSELTKFNTIVGVMESDILSAVSDIVLDPPTAHPYEAIKRRLVKHYAETDNRKITCLLHELTLGDMKPSNLLRKMIELSCGKFGEELLKTLWLQRLPVNVQQNLSVRTDNLSELARMADAMLDITEFPAVQTVDVELKRDDLVKTVCELEGKIERLQRDFRESGQRSNRVSRHRSPTPSEASSVTNKKLCFYHDKFGKKAKKCSEPCSFAKKNVNKNLNKSNGKQSEN